MKKFLSTIILLALLLTSCTSNVDSPVSSSSGEIPATPTDTNPIEIPATPTPPPTDPVETPAAPAESSGNYTDIPDSTPAVIEIGILFIELGGYYDELFDLTPGKAYFDSEYIDVVTVNGKEYFYAKKAGCFSVNCTANNYPVGSKVEPYAILLGTLHVAAEGDEYFQYAQKGLDVFGTGESTPVTPSLSTPEATPESTPESTPDDEPPGKIYLEGLKILDVGFNLTKFDQFYFNDENAPSTLNVNLFGVDYDVLYDESLSSYLLGQKIHCYESDEVEVYVDAETGDVVYYLGEVVDIPDGLTTTEEYIDFVKTLLPSDIDYSEYRIDIGTRFIRSGENYAEVIDVMKFLDTPAENEKIHSYKFYFTKMISGHSTREVYSVFVYMDGRVRFEKHAPNYKEEQFEEIIPLLGEIEQCVLQHGFLPDLSSLYKEEEESKRVLWSDLFIRDGVPCVYTKVRYILIDKLMGEKYDFDFVYVSYFEQESQP